MKTRAAFALAVLAGLSACSAIPDAPVCFQKVNGELRLASRACDPDAPKPQPQPATVKRMNPRTS